MVWKSNIETHLIMEWSKLSSPFSRTWEWSWFISDLVILLTVHLIMLKSHLILGKMEMRNGEPLNTIISFYAYNRAQMAWWMIK